MPIDRELFSEKVTEKIRSNSNILIYNEEVREIPDAPTIIASGPLTSSDLANAIKDFTGASIYTSLTRLRR